MFVSLSKKTSISISMAKFAWKPHLFKWVALDEKDAHYYGYHKFYEFWWLWLDIEVYVE